jgi:hypothetical protein
MGNRMLNFDPFPRTITLFEQNLVYKHRNVIRKYETTIPYSQIATFYLTEGIFFSKIEILSSGLIQSKEVRGGIILRFLSKRKARIIKFLLNEKMKQFQNKNKEETPVIIEKIENYLYKLYDLKNKGKMKFDELDERRDNFLMKILKANQVHK